MENPEWSFVSAIPGVATRRSIDAGEIALIGPSDSRYQDLLGEHRVLRDFLESFYTPLGVQLRPSIIVRRESDDRIAAESLVRIRNLAAIAAVLECWIKGFQHGYSSGPACSDLFDIYPIHPTRDYAELIVYTQFERAVADTQGFRGQPAPVTAHNDRISVEYDDTLLAALLSAYTSTLQSSRPSASAERVFRSIAAAYQAFRSPFIHLGSTAEQGLAFSMWVTAFEILAHPGQRNVVFRDVSKMVKDVPWHCKELHYRRYRPIDRRKKKSDTLPNVSLPVKIYGRLYKTRNHYFHGNPLKGGGFEPDKKPNWPDLRYQIPALYRNVLLHELASSGYGAFPAPIVSDSDRLEDLDDESFASIVVASYIQEEYEKPLLPKRYWSP